MALGADSEVGRLRTVMLHRPGPELGRLTPRNNDQLLFDGIPWLGRAQEEHDAFAQALRDHDVEVLYLAQLLIETLAIDAAREEIIASTLTGLFVGPLLQDDIAGLLRDAHPEKLAEVLMAGLRNDEVSLQGSVAHHLMQPEHFLINPLPNLLFTRDSSVWLRDRVAVTSLAMPARVRETQLTGLIYAHHPRFAGTPVVHGPHLEHLEGGDVLELSPGVIAVGIGERTTPAGLERFAHQVLAEGLAHTLLAVPIAQERATMHLDTIVTMVDVDTVVIYPTMSDALRSVPLTWSGRSASAPRRPSSRARPRRWASRPSTRSTPASIRSRPSASSGTTATTPWRSTPASRSRTSATSRPTPGSRSTASRSSRSAATSSDQAAAVRAACPARSTATDPGLAQDVGADVAIPDRVQYICADILRGAAGRGAPGVKVGARPGPGG